MPRQDPYPAYLVAIPCLEAALVLVPFIVTFTVIVGLARGEVCL